MKIPALIICASLAAIPFARAADADNGAATNAPAPPNEMSGTNGIVLNFHEAPLNIVLDYLSEKAGYIVTSDDELRAKVTLEAAQPVSKTELADVLNDMLAKNGYRAIFNGRMLTIKRIGDTTSETPIFTGSDPDKIPTVDTVRTQILPVHSLDPVQLLKDLEQLIPSGAKTSSDEAGSAIIMTAPARDIHHFAEIVKALDGSAVSSFGVFMLKYGDAKSVASELKEIFQSADSGVTRANNFRQMAAGGGGGRMRFNPFGGFGGPGGFGGGGGGNESGQNNNPNTQAVFTSDDQVNAVVAAAPPELMPAITNVILQLDQPSDEITLVRVFHLRHADPTETADELTSLFSTQNNNDQNTRGPGFRFFGGRFGGGGGGGNNNEQSDRMKRQSQVQAVADPRTESVIVTASKTLMEEIAGMIADLDRSDANKMIVTTYDISTADPIDVQSAMQALFQGQNRPAANTTQNSPLELRAENAANQQTGTAATSFGQNGTGTGGAGGR